MHHIKIKCLAALAMMAFGDAAPSTLRAAEPQLLSPFEATTHSIPDRTAGLAQNSISLDGLWQVRLEPKGRWHKATVPGELAMQGYAVAHDQPVTYRRTINVPASFGGHKLMLRFDGAYSYATLRVNGHEVRRHRGGFSRWEADVTSLIKPGKANVVELDLTDPIDEISYASGYAHHPVFGILRSVTLYAQPLATISDLRLDARLDTLYRDGELQVALRFSGPEPLSEPLSEPSVRSSFGSTRAPEGSDQLRIDLTDPSGRTAAKAELPLHEGLNSFSIPVGTPAKWDAEHPRLYTARLTLLHDGQETATFSRKVGFRRIEIDGARMLVNGRPVKLRGACRHDIHPSLGRATDRATDSIDALLFKESNMNFVRTSHYPPSEDFLEFCDRYGIYVEGETAACFVNTHRQRNYAPGASQSDTAKTAQYLGQLSEMVKSFQSHPSVLFWSIGNESSYGSNFQQSYDWVKAYDPTRPAIFSYPGLAKEAGHQIFDLASMHYQDVNGNLWQYGVESRNFQVDGLPTIFDEWAHPACYTYQTLQTDPGIREFWGQSLDRMWEGVYRTPGALGGAIWGYVDEIFPLPEMKVGEPYWVDFAHTAKPDDVKGRCVGYGEWGIVDIYRRRKPEFWATKKAYSPIRVTNGRTLSPAPDTDINLTLYNRFDHTNLSETNARAIYGSDTIVLAMPSAEPHERAALRVPARAWAEGDSLALLFTGADGNLIDSYIFTIGSAPNSARPLRASTSGSKLTIDRAADFITIRGDGFAIPFSRSSGLIEGATGAGGAPLIERGPYLNAYINYNHLTGAEVRKIASHIEVNPADWRLGSLSVEVLADGNAAATITGTYGDIRADFRIIITPDGGLTTSYSVEDCPDGYLRETGLSFILPDDFTILTWEREGYWDSYPADAMSGNRGTASLYPADRDERYGAAPERPDWAGDAREFFYWADAGSNSPAPLTRRAKAMKENVTLYSLSTPTGASLTVTAPGADVACRLNKPGEGSELVLYADNRCDYPEIAWGNFCRATSPLPFYGQISLVLR